MDITVEFDFKSAPYFSQQSTILFDYFKTLA